MKEYDEEFYENAPRDTCSNCGRSYDDIDFDFQACSKCGWDADQNKFDKGIIRMPNDSDYLSGEASVLTGRFN